MSATNSGRTPSGSTSSLHSRPLASQSTRRSSALALPLASAKEKEKEKDRSGQRIASLASNNKVTSAKSSVDASRSISSISVTARKKENVACAQLRCGDDLTGDRGISRGEGYAMSVRDGRVGRVSVVPVVREKSPTKLPLPSAVQARDRKPESTRTDVSALGRRRRVGLSIRDGQAWNERASVIVKGSDGGETEGLKKVGDAKINAAAGRALLRRSSTRNSSRGSAVSNDMAKTENIEKHCVRDSEPLNRKSDNSFSIMKPSRVSSTSSRASYTGRRESGQKPATSVAPSQSRRLSHRQSSLRSSLECRELLGGKAASAGNMLGARSRNVSLTSTVSANDLSTLQKSNNKTPARWRPSGDELRWNETQLIQSRAIPVRSLRQSRRSTSSARGAEKQLIPNAREKYADTDNTICSSVEVIRLQAETLQLHILHSLVATNVSKKSIQTNRSLRENLFGIEAAYKAMRSKEQAAQSLINQIALHSWNYGGDSDGSQADNIALLVTILDEFPALLGSDDEKAGVSCASESGNASDSEYLYAHLVEVFQSWMHHVRQVWQARGEHSIGPAVSSTTSSTTEFFTYNQPANTHTYTLSNKSPYTIIPLPSSWYTDLAALGHKLDILSGSLEELEAAPEGSTLASTLQRCATFLVNARQEIREMKEIEEMVFALAKREAKSKD